MYITKNENDNLPGNNKKDDNEFKLPEKEFDIPVPERKDEKIKADKTEKMNKSTAENKESDKDNNNGKEKNENKKNEKAKEKRNNEPEHKNRDNSNPVIEDAEWTIDKINEANNEVKK